MSPPLNVVTAIIVMDPPSEVERPFHKFLQDQNKEIPASNPWTESGPFCCLQY
jgi:hypothetical protein